MARFEIRMPEKHNGPYVFWGWLEAQHAPHARQLATQLYNSKHRKHPIHPLEVRAIEIEPT